MTHKNLNKNSLESTFYSKLSELSMNSFVQVMEINFLKV